MDSQNLPETYCGAVLHGGSTTINREFGHSIHCFYWDVPEGRKLDAIAVRDPLEVACSWTSRDARCKGDCEQQQWERLIAYAEVHPEVPVIVVESIDRIENAKLNTADPEIEKQRLRQWIGPHIRFFERFGYNMEWAK